MNGASSGLGMEFATILAEAVFNLILSARNQEILINLSEKLKAIHSIETHIIVGDLTESTTIENIISSSKEYNNSSRNTKLSWNYLFCFT